MATQAGVINVDDRAQNVQLRVGVLAVSAALALAVVFANAGVGLAAHLALFPLFLVGTYGIGAGLWRVCAMTAMRGKRLASEGAEPVADRAEREALRRRGAKVIALSVLVSATATVLLSFPLR
jgi:hypothetical protein